MNTHTNTHTHTLHAASLVMLTQNFKSDQLSILNVLNATLVHNNGHPEGVGKPRRSRPGAVITL